MGVKGLVRIAGVAFVSALVACSQDVVEERVGEDIAGASAASFDKDLVLTDAELRDATAMSAEDIQAFLEKTPWGHASVLATYEEDGRSAARIIKDAATKYGINPLELLVRVQMEQSLVYKKTAPAETIAIAFGCGCPHSPVCSPKYEGFANQAECAAGTLRRSMDRALTSSGTASGWKKGEAKLTQDKIEIVPQSAATAALYTYTPWVGEAGGGRKGVGGVSLHQLVWTRFADALGYEVGKPGGATPDQTRDEDAKDAGAPEPAPGKDPGAGPRKADAGPPAENPPNGGPGSAGEPKKDDADGEDREGTPPADEGEDDDDILGEGNMPPSSLPPPRSSGPRGRGSDLPEATEEELSIKKRRSSVSNSGCSAAGGASDGSGALTALALGAVVLASRRRRAGK
jgi:MYXO-CTERM domain-containing protein